jgi:hypothetical protein
MLLSVCASAVLVVTVGLQHPVTADQPATPGWQVMKYVVLFTLLTHDSVSCVSAPILLLHCAVARLHSLHSDPDGTMILNPSRLGCRIQGLAALFWSLTVTAGCRMRQLVDEREYACKTCIYTAGHVCLCVIVTCGVHTVCASAGAHPQVHAMHRLGRCPLKNIAVDCRYALCREHSRVCTAT